jgi:hypothetical protein
VAVRILKTWTAFCSSWQCYQCMMCAAHMPCILVSWASDLPFEAESDTCKLMLPYRCGCVVCCCSD